MLYEYESWTLTFRDALHDSILDTISFRDMY